MFTTVGGGVTGQHIPKSRIPAFSALHRRGLDIVNCAGFWHPRIRGDRPRSKVASGLNEAANRLNNGRIYPFAPTKEALPVGQRRAS